MLREAVRFDEAGMDILIDFHFSDTWADPGAQHAPAAWADLSLEEAKDAMVCWVECTMKALPPRAWRWTWSSSATKPTPA